MIDLFYQSYIKARKTVLKPTQRDLYDSLEKLVFGVTNNTRSKIYFGANYKGSRKGNKEDYHTDEQLVSLALCLSVQGNESCIMTRDSDLRRILLNTVRYLSDPNIFSSQDYLLDSIRGNRIRIYHTFSSGEGEIVLDTSEFNPTTRLSREERNGIDQALRD